MPKGHESKLFITVTTFHSARVQRHVHRTRAAARRFQTKQKTRRAVAACTIDSATWGPDA